MNIKHFRIIIGLFLVLLSFLSCSPKILGYGTILWSEEDDSYSTGQVITIISESELADVFLIRDSSEKEPVQMDRWRVAFFEDRVDAENYSQSILEFKDIYARNLKDGLLIRQEPDINSERAYKLRENQIMKVYGRSAEITAIGQYDGYWYQVITEEGVTGFCFDHYLDIYDNSISPEKKENPAEILLNTAFVNIYHPSKFVDMINNSAINLNTFKPNIGLFPDPENKNLKIVTNNYTINFSWDTPVLVDKRSFSLGEEGIIVHVLSESKLQVNYYYEDQKVITNYLVIENIEDIILQETERREALYNTIIETGSSFSSNAYGTITMKADGSFSWINYDKLVPQIIPSGSEGTGRIRFNKFISNNLEEEYTGVISFYFSYGEKLIAIDFLYTLDENKLRLTYVPENNIDSLNIVSKKSISPVVIAFSAN